MSSTTASSSQPQSAQSTPAPATSSTPTTSPRSISPRPAVQASASTSISTTTTTATSTSSTSSFSSPAVQSVKKFFIAAFVVAALTTLLNVSISLYAGGWAAQYVSPPFSTNDIPNLAGKVAIVTGANYGGIGYVTALELARKGASVIVGSRSEEKGNDAVQRIKSSLKGVEGAGEAFFMKLDLANFKTIQQFVKTFKTQFKNKLDILILNAGIVMCEYQTTVDGFEMQMGTNHIGHFLLTKLLLPLFKSSKTRIVTVSSESHRDTYPEGIRFDAFKNDSQYSRIYAYGQSKLANNLFSNELAVRLAGTGATSNVLHPGLVRTEGSRHLLKGFEANIFTRILAFWLKEVLLSSVALSLEAGALTQLYVATSPKLAGVSGRYYVPIGKDLTQGQSEHAKNATLAKRLWEVSEKFTKGY